jgi:PLP dependent protein
MTISNNLQKIKEKIKNKLESCSRTDDITIVAATKYANVKQITELLDCGIKVIGENKVKDAIEKFKLIQNFEQVEKHMIGHLQTNKVKKVVENFDCIQSVDSIKLAKEIDKHAKNSNKIMQIMIQLNISREPQKFGIKPGDAEDFFNQLLKLKNINVIGLMAIAPNVDKEKTRAYFKEVKKINEKLKLKHLSMGMSSDYTVAIEEGSTMIRVGSSLFS